MSMERRKSENSALRELVNALKQFINSRDELWSLRFYDRLFRLDKCRETFNRYDTASLAVRDAIRAVTAATEAALDDGRDEIRQPGTPTPFRQPPLVTMEEFEVLLGKPGIAPKSVHRKKLA